jgi:hypothetical protein
VCGFAEILGFYGLCYWYTYQVSVLGIGPIWMSGNEKAKAKAKRLLDEGNIFAFGLSEKEHGADIYSSDMIVTKLADGTYSATGGKYYIGNANKAAMVSTFGKMADTGADTSSSSQIRSTRSTSSSRTRSTARTTWPSTACTDYPLHRRRRAAPWRRRLERRAQHRQRRQVQPGLGLHRHLHPRVL